MNAKETQYAMETVLNSMRGIGKQLSTLNAELGRVHSVLDDLRHEHELSPLNAAEMIRVFLDERSALRQRRVILNEIKVLENFKAFYDDTYGLKDKLQTAVNAMNATKHRIRIARYQPKVLQGLKCSKVHMEML